MNKKLNIQPLFDKVLIEPINEEEITPSGIIIPQVTKEKPQEGRVIAVGPGKKDELMAVKPGDMVLYGKYGGTEVVLNGKPYIIIRVSEIHAIV